MQQTNYEYVPGAPVPRWIHIGKPYVGPMTRVQWVQFIKAKHNTNISGALNIFNARVAHGYYLQVPTFDNLTLR